MTILLYSFYVLFYFCLFLTNGFFLAYYFFWFVIVPIALAPISLEGIQNIGRLRISKPYISLENPLATIKPGNSMIFICIICFGASLVLSSAFIPTFSFHWLSVFSGYFIAIGLFILITARLSSSGQDFEGAFFTCFCLIVAVNACINIFLYLSQLPSIFEFPSNRMTLNFGRAPDHYPTTGALSYAIALAASAGLVVSERNLIRRVVGVVSSIVLFIALCLMQSRGPLFGALGALIMSGCVSVNPSRRRVLILMSLIAAISFLMIPELGRSAILRGDNHRFEVWSKFFHLALERPIFGFGERLQINVEISDGEILGHGHNIFLSAFLRGGIIALISILAIYAMSLINSFLLDLRFKKPIPFCVLTTVSIASLVDFDLIIFLSDWQWSCFWLPFGLAIGAEKKDEI